MTGNFSGTHTQPCASGSVTGSFSGTLTAVVQPSLDTLTASGGSFTASAFGGGTAVGCDGTGAITFSGTFSGTVSPGGAVSFSVTGMGNGDESVSGSGSGTTSALSGQVAVSNTDGDSGSATFSLNGAPASNLNGSFTASGTAYCSPGSTDNTTGQVAASGLLVATVQPSLSSLTASGGAFSGSLSGGGSVSNTCNTTLGLTSTGSISGTVSPGGSVSWSFTLNTIDTEGNAVNITGSNGGGTTSALSYSGTFFDSSQEPSPLSASIVLSASAQPTQSTSPPLQISAGGSSQVALPAGTAGTAYSQNLPASGGTPPYTWSLAGGALPHGLTLASNGFLSGTPTQSGSAAFSATVTDLTGTSASSQFALTVAPQALAITTTSLPNGIVGTPYPAQVFTASGGTPPYTFQITSPLPAGFTFSNGAIGGTPTTAGSFTISVSVSDSSSPALTGSAQLSLTVNPSHTDLILSQSSLTFTISSGASQLPAGARISVQSNNPSQTIAYTTSVSPTAPWLAVQSGGSTPGALDITLTPQALQLKAGAQTSIVVSCAAGSPCAGNSQTVAVSLILTVAPPQLAITTPSLAFTASSANPQPVSATLGLSNTGGGSITVNSLTPANTWISISGSPTSLAGGSSYSATVTVDPTDLAAGFYQSAIAVATSVGTVSVPLTLLIAPSAAITLNPSGTVFNALAGSLPGNPAGSFEVSATGDSSLGWTASVLPGAAWLTLNTASGTSTASAPGVVNFTINSAAASLPANAYYGAIQISSPDAVDSPQSYLVVLNVVAAATAVTPAPQPAGLLFIASSGTPAAQTVQVYAGTSVAQDYQAASDSSWLSVSPATGSTSSTAPGASSVSVNLKGLTAGVYTGGVSYAFSGAAVRTVNVTLIVEANAVASSDRKGSQSLPTAACVPANLVPTETGLVNSFSQPAGWPTPLSILLTDDCGQPITNGQVVATFSNGDPPLILSPADVITGTYSATWTPRNTAQQIAISVTASAPNLASATTQIAGQVTPNAAPVLAPNGTLNAFAIAAEPGAPFAPGTIIQIYGSNLASQAAAAGAVPLPTSLNQTAVIIGGMTAPLYYASPGQINAQIPFELTAGSPYQLIVNANGALSTPYSIQLVPDAPAIAQFAGGKIIAQHQDGSLVTESSPAAPGEYLIMYLVGMGLTNQTVPSGTPSPSAKLAAALDAPTVTLNGGPVTNVLYAGLTPTEVGLYQVNFQVPANAANGDLSLVVTQSSGVSNSTILPVHN